MQKQPVHVAGRALGRVRHICAFFHNKEEEYQTLTGFIKEGIERHEKAFHIVDARCCDQHRARLQREGIDTTAAESSGQLKVACWEDAYLQEGHFNQDRQIRLIQSVLEQGKQEGFPLTRLIANMEWALEDKAGVEDIVEYESRLNYVLPHYEDPVVCTYDLSRFNAGVAMDILRTHPMVIIGGILQDNPLYVPPDEFLKELHQRGGSN
jgi:hypothetical protein